MSPHLQQPHKNQRRKLYYLAYLGIGLLLIIIVSSTLAQTNSFNLNQDEQLLLTCSSDRLQISPVSKTSVLAHCISQAKPTEPAPEPTVPVPEPTEPAPEPTEPAPEPTQPPPPEPTQPSPEPTEPAPMLGNVYYLSKNGSNRSGQSWADAWNELDQINWQIIAPGDTIMVDGGETEMIYTTSLQIAQSGTADKPITIQRSEQAGHNGQAIFFGGRATPLPYCYQEDYDYQPGKFDYGIRTNDHSWIIIDGTKWSGIALHGYQKNGIRIDRNSTNLLVRHVEIYDNGFARKSSSKSGWVSDEPGVRLAGKNIIFERSLIHDNGQDAFQSLHGQNNIENFTLKQSWLYNERQHPTVNESANYCSHSDGIQIYDGGIVKNINLIESIIGPGFTQGVILGQTTTSSGSWAAVQDVTMQNVLFAKGADNNILGYSKTDSQNWRLDHVTAYCPQTKYNCIRIYHANHEITNSIFYGANLNFPDGLDKFANNCQWQTRGFTLGNKVDPRFVGVTSDPFSLDNYSLAANSSCAGMGSSITSVQQLLNLPDPR